MARCGHSVFSRTMSLFDSICYNNTVTLQTLLHKGVDIETKVSKGRTLLLFACFLRRKPIVSLLIKKGANVDGKSRRGEYTVLHYAAMYGWIKIVRYLVNKVSDLNAKDVNGETPLHLASKTGRLTIVKCLIKKGADIDCKNFKGITPLLCAAQCKLKAVFDLLINARVNIDDHKRLLLYYAARNKWTDALQLLVTRVPNLNKRMGDVAMDTTSSGGHLELVKCFVEGSDGNRENEMISQAALFHASHLGHFEVVKWLMMTGSDMVPDLNGQNELGCTALHLASNSAHMEIVKYLVELGADINVKDYRGFTSWQNSSRKGHFEILKYLVEKGADVNVRFYNAFNFLFYAASRGHKDVVDLLISSGADFNTFHWRKQTLLHFIAQHNWADTAQFLLNKGWDLDVTDGDRKTSLGTACCYQHFETAQVLLQAGANWDTTDINGNSPLNYITAQERPDFKFIKLLIGHGAYLKPVDYNALVKSSSLEVLQDAKFCCQAIINRFNNHDLCELYKLSVSESLPCIEKMKIMCDSEVAQAIERNVGFEIQTNGHCNILKVSPMALSVFSVKSVLKYHKEKSLKLRNGMKRPAAFDSDQHSNKSIRLC